MKILRTLAVFLLAMLILPIMPAKADGGIYVPHNYYGYETSQQAVIYYSNQMETLVVSAGFRGNAKDFSWVIPLPAKPEIDKASSGLFRTLASITNDSTTTSNLSSGLNFSAGPKTSGVEVISEKTVDVYDTAVLKASDEKSLSTWLSDHGYNYPAEQDAALKSYVERGWYFAAARIQPNLANDASTGVALAYGNLTPLKFTFQSDKIIYPMKLTAIVLKSASSIGATTPVSDLPVGSQPEIVSKNIPVTLYVISTTKVEESLLSTDYANWLSKNGSTEIADDLSEIKASNSKLFLTKMAATLSPDQISDDFTLSVAANNSVYPAPAYKTADFWVSNLLILFLVIVAFIFLPPIGLIFVVSIILQTRVRKKWLHILGSIYQILICLLLPLVTAVALATAYSDSSSFADLILKTGTIGALLSVVILEIAVIFATIKMFYHFKKTYS